jgi:pilus assembly protein Flp/PilA
VAGWELDVSKSLRLFIKEQSGATAIEYGIIASFIALALITVLASIGTEVQGPFVDAETGLKKRPAV